MCSTPTYLPSFHSATSWSMLKWLKYSIILPESPGIVNKWTLNFPTFQENCYNRSSLVVFENDFFYVIFRSISVYLKFVSAFFIKFLFFHQMIFFKKLWKMFFISSKKLFSFLRYSNCCNFFPSFPNFPDSKGQMDVE